MRLPPKSEPRDWVIWPKLDWLTSRMGSARLGTWGKAPSARRWMRAVWAKALLAPVEWARVPGPVRSPTDSVPKRPMGAWVWPVRGSGLVLPTMQLPPWREAKPVEPDAPRPPGQVKAAVLNH